MIVNWAYLQILFNFLQINDILQLSALGGTVDDTLSNPYTVSHAVVQTAGPVTPLPTGLTVTDGVEAGNTANKAALSITSFNTFRVQVATAINTLQTKIDQILDQRTLSCWSESGLSGLLEEKSDRMMCQFENVLYIYLKVVKVS